MVEAAGIEPARSINPNPLMARDFGCYGMKTMELPRQFESPRVPSCPLESPRVPWSPPPVLEIYWRREEAHFPLHLGDASRQDLKRSHWYVLLAEA